MSDDTGLSDIQWRPSKEIIAESAMRAFLDRVALADLDALNRKADADPAWFWDAALEFMDMRFYRPYDRVLDQSRGVQWPEWCVGGTTNVVLNCIDRHRDTPIWSKSSEMNRATLSALPDPAHDLYADAFAAMFKAAGDVARRAIPAERVGDAVIHALTAKRPKTRYLVGTDAKIQAFMRRWLPDLRRDNMIARFMKIP